MTNICLKCGHDIGAHKMQIIGNYNYVEIACTEEPYEKDYGERCGCDAGFGKVVIKKEFSQMKGE